MEVAIANIFLQIIQEMSHASNEAELFKCLKLAVESLEFDYCAYDVLVTYPVTKSTFTSNNNYPETWKVKYEKNNCLEYNPIRQHCLTSTRPFTWAPNNIKTHKTFWEDAFKHGLKLGWAKSGFLEPGATGILTVARNNQEQLSSCQHLCLQALSSVFQTVYIEIVTNKKTDITNFKLTKREKEILQWCADGKTSDQIAMILSITKRTVDFHTANAIQKLQVNNKTAAAVKAIQLGLF